MTDILIVEYNKEIADLMCDYLRAEKYTVSALLYAQEALSNAELQVQFNAVFPQCIEVCIANIRQKNK